MNQLTVIGVVVIALVLLYEKVRAWFGNREVLKRLTEQKKKELQEIEDQVKILKEADIRKEKTYEEAKVKYLHQYHPVIDDSSDDES